MSPPRYRCRRSPGAASGAWQPPVRLNETTSTYFKRLADVSAAEDAARYRAVLTDGPARTQAVDHFAKDEPTHAAMLRAALSPNIIQGGYRSNVIPSEAKATIDVRLLPGENQDEFHRFVRFHWDILLDTARAR